MGLFASQPPIAVSPVNMALPLCHTNESIGLGESFLPNTIETT